MKLFANLYLDEDVNVVIAKLVRAQGLFATTALEAGQTHKSDVEQLQFAAERRLVILTHNRNDFQELAASFAAAKRFHAGIVIAIRRPPREVFQRLMDLLNDWTADEFENQVFYI